MIIQLIIQKLFSINSSTKLDISSKVKNIFIFGTT